MIQVQLHSLQDRDLFYQYKESCVQKNILTAVQQLDEHVNKLEKNWKGPNESGWWRQVECSNNDSWECGLIKMETYTGSE